MRVAGPIQTMETKKVRPIHAERGRYDSNIVSVAGTTAATQTRKVRPTAPKVEGTTDSHDWSGKYNRHKSLWKARPIEVVKESTTSLSNQGRHDPYTTMKEGTIQIL